MYRALCFFFLPATLLANVPAPTDEGSLQAVVENADSRSQAAINELRRIAESELTALAKERDGSGFLRFLQTPGVAEDLLTSGDVPKPLNQALQSLLLIWRADSTGLNDPHERTTALAVALTFSNEKWPSSGALARYQYYRDSRKAGLLHPVFNGLATWEKRFVVDAGQNGSYSKEGGPWDDRSLVWLRDNVKLPIEEYTGACWQPHYRLENVFGDSIHGPKYYMPFENLNHAQRVRDVGGVCGSLSHYGTVSAQANGIPATTMGEPGHCAFAVRIAPGKWTPAYSLDWKRGLHASLWSAKTWTSLVLQDKVLGDRKAHVRSMGYLWQARALAEKNPDLAQAALNLALEAQPLNQPAWQEVVAWQKSHKPSLETWQALQEAALKSLSDYPEAAWDVVKEIQAAALPMIPADKQIAFLSRYHQEIAKKDGPVMWEYEKAITEQSKLLGSDTKRQLAFFEAVLGIQTVSKSWFAPTIAWGQEQFSKSASDQFYAALGRAFSSSAAGSNPDGLKAALGPAILSAEKNDNVSAFQTLGKAGSSYLPKETLKVEAFPGDLLSSGGLLKPTSTCRWDSPEMHWGVLEPTGGKFHTDKGKNTGVVVRLGKLGELSGIVIVNDGGGQNGGRQLPMKVSVSEDGSSWTEVFHTETNSDQWRILLAGKPQAARVQFVKVERDGDREDFFHLRAIQVYGRRLQ